MSNYSAPKINIRRVRNFRAEWEKRGGQWLADCERCGSIEWDRETGWSISYPSSVAAQAAAAAHECGAA